MRSEWGAHAGPSFLHAAGDAAFERGERDALHEHAQMRPLAVAHAFVDDKEEPDWRAEKLEVLEFSERWAEAIGQVRAVYAL